MQDLEEGLTDDKAVQAMPEATADDQAMPSPRKMEKRSVNFTQEWLRSFGLEIIENCKHVYI